jgi:hypothetical protein
MTPHYALERSVKACGWRAAGAWPTQCERQAHGRSTMKISSLVSVLLVGVLSYIGQVRGDDTKPEPRLVEVTLTETERLSLISAPQVFFNAKPSSALENAWANGEVAKVRADRVVDGDSNAVQGWIYYPTVAGYQPMVLCVSETFPVLVWMHCQEHGDSFPIAVSSPDS